MRSAPASLGAWLLMLACAAGAAADEAPSRITIGSKKFTESVILGEIASGLFTAEHHPTAHLRELGGSRVLWNALLTGDIDIYPEYTGTLLKELLAKDPDAEKGIGAVREKLARRGILIGAPLGFNNTYALGMRKLQASRLGIETISDLRRHPALRFGFGNEFLHRADGWGGLRLRYRLPQRPIGLDHDIAYRALANAELDVIDLYSTDAEIAYYDIRVIRDDRNYFPDYQALFLYRERLAALAPKAMQKLASLRIDAEQMRAMNAQSKLANIPENKIARDFLYRALRIEIAADSPHWLSGVWHHTREHLVLVLISLNAALIFSIPMGMLAHYHPGPGRLILGFSGIVQTIPSLALLVFMIPWFGIGAPSAIFALFLYSLLPIVRNTYTGLQSIPQSLRDSADALGLPLQHRMFKIDLPLALPTMLAGIKTAAVINVGTATLGALIGAGGLGQPILTGIRLDDMNLILQGAVPAALLALLVQGAFALGERHLIPKGMTL